MLTRQMPSQAYEGNVMLLQQQQVKQPFVQEPEGEELVKDSIALTPLATLSLIHI